MAEINWSDEGDIEKLLNDVDPDSDFEGFDIEDIVAGRNTILAEMSMNDFVPENDQNLPDDVENGWDKIDFPPIIVPFTGTIRHGHRLSSSHVS